MILIPKNAAKIPRKFFENGEWTTFSDQNLAKLCNRFVSQIFVHPYPNIRKWLPHSFASSSLLYSVTGPAAFDSGGHFPKLTQSALFPSFPPSFFWLINPSHKGEQNVYCEGKRGILPVGPRVLLAQAANWPLPFSSTYFSVQLRLKAHKDAASPFLPFQYSSLREWRRWRHYFLYVSALIGCGYTLIPPTTYVVANFVEWAIEAYGGTSFTMLKERRAKRQLPNVTGYG